MYNSIFIEPTKQHCHRFLWRDLNTDRDPDVYIIQRVNMGDKPAGAISSEALYKTATLFEKEYLRVAEVLRHSTYVDDIIDSVPSLEEAVSLAADTDTVLLKAGFKVKGWQFTKETAAHQQIQTELEPVFTEPTTTRVLGLMWKPQEDHIIINARLNFSPKKKGQYTKEDLTSEELGSRIPEILTKRITLEQVMKIYDPLGFVTPFTLQAKCLLRETWVQNLKWDDPLPDDLRSKWVTFFEQLITLREYSFPRCIKPENTVGKPSLIIFSDGSKVAYGFAAYIRWKLDKGEYHCRLICSKSRIAPMKTRSIPQMELNAAVLLKRARTMLESKMIFEFERAIHLIDSETVLSMIDKLSTRFKTYEGARIGEIQAATNGDMSSWYWVNGKANIADWLTRPKNLHELYPNSALWKGPSFLYSDIDSWDIKPCKSYAKESTDDREVSTFTADSSPVTEQLVDYTIFGRAKKLRWTMVRVIGIFKNKSFKGMQTTFITTDILDLAHKILVKDAQKTMIPDLNLKSQGRYSKLKPVKLQDIWVVGTRMTPYNPLTDDAPQLLLPTKHAYTHLLMKGGT